MSHGTKNLSLIGIPPFLQDFLETDFDSNLAEFDKKQYSDIISFPLLEDICYRNRQLTIGGLDRLNLPMRPKPRSRVSHASTDPV